jgi:hypothetical protein
MAAVTLLGTQTFTTTSGTKTVTATPAVDDLIVIITAHTGNTSSAAPTDDNNTGRYALIGSAVKATSADTMRAWVRTDLIRAASSTVFTHAPGTTSGGGLAVFKVTGMSRCGITAAARLVSGVVQFGKQDNQAAATPGPALPAAADTNNPTIGAVFNATSPAGMTQPTNWTERSDTGYSTPTSGLETVSRDSGFTGTTVTWGSASGSAFCSLILELDASATPVKALSALGVG